MHSLHCNVTKKVKVGKLKKTVQVNVSEMLTRSKRRHKTICKRYVLCNILIPIIFAVKRRKLFCAEFFFAFDELFDVMSNLLLP